MTPKLIRRRFRSAVDLVVSKIEEHVVHPGRDFIRHYKLPADDLITFLVAEGSSSTKNELTDFFDMDPDHPSSSAFYQQRSKLLPSALEGVFHGFNTLCNDSSDVPKYRLIAADGSTASFQSSSVFASEEYFSNPGKSSAGCYSIHINAFYDLQKRTYTDALLQPVHQKDEFLAFCTIVDRHPVIPGSHNVYIGDRGYCSYNNMAHVIHSGQYFLFRAKDIHQKGLLGGFSYPDSDAFDMSVNVTLTRCNRSDIPIHGDYRRFIGKSVSFDYIEYGARDTYDLSFRIVRFPISEDTYESIVTNLPEDEFPLKRIKEIYFCRWGVETSFRKLKYTIGLSSFHSHKPEFIKQEIWARMIAYNITETIINYTVVHTGETKHVYKINFSVAAHICRSFLRPAAEERLIDVVALLQRELIPIRNDRKYSRSNSAHFRKPRYFTYRPS